MSDIFNPAAGTGTFVPLSSINQPNGVAGLDSNGDLVGTILIRRLTNTSLNSTVLAQGNLCMTTDAPFRFVLGDGSSTGINLNLPFASGDLWVAKTANLSTENFVLLNAGATSDDFDGDNLKIFYTATGITGLGGTVVIGNLAGDAFNLQTYGAFSFGSNLYCVPARAVPTTGQTVVLSSYQTILNPAGTLAALTVQLPASPVQGRHARVSCSQIVTTLTVDGNGNTVTGLAPITSTAGWFAEYIYSSTAPAGWFRVG